MEVEQVKRILPAVLHFTLELDLFSNPRETDPLNSLFLK